jgi:hypothetical protein
VLVTGHWLLVTGYWSLGAGHWYERFIELIGFTEFKRMLLFVLLNFDTFFRRVVEMKISI